MKVMVFVLGLLVTCHTAPVDKGQSAGENSEEEDEDLHQLLNEMKQTLADMSNNKQPPPIQVPSLPLPPKAPTPDVMANPIPVHNVRPSFGSFPAVPQISFYITNPAHPPMSPVQQPTQGIARPSPIPQSPVPQGAAYGNFLPSPAMPSSIPQPGMVPQYRVPFAMPQTNMANPPGSVFYPFINPAQSTSFYNPAQSTPFYNPALIQVSNPQVMPQAPQIPFGNPYGPAGAPNYWHSAPRG